MPNTRHDPLRDYLFKAILTLETVEDCYNFFDDLCTIKEINEMAKRMCVAGMLQENTVYTEINEKTGLSTATISRINRCLKYGSDGYTEVLRRLEEKGIDRPEMTGKEGRG
ncbi:MAG: TrpR-like protein, YerC/YecD [Clostridiales bacterium]|nr:TrpR-like protein, YerC/YecD [Clostridiales bacterium]